VEDPLIPINGVCLVLLRGPPGCSRTFNRLLGDRRSSVDRRQE